MDPLPTLDYRNPAVRNSGRPSALAILLWAVLTITLFGIAVTVLLPLKGRSRDHPPRLRSSSNMRMIGLGLLMYANESNGAFPPNLAIVAATQDLPSEVFVAPQSNLDRAAPDPDGKWAYKIVPGGPHCSYIYVYRPDFTDQMHASTVVLYEPPSINSDGGANVLYADGHVDWLDAKKAKAVIGQVEAGINPPK